MALEFVSSNGPRAMRVARKIVKPLDWADIESVVTNSMNQSEYDELFTAVDSDFLKSEKHLQQLYQTLRDVLPDEESRKLLGDYSDLHLRQDTTKMIAWFQLGYATALRLLGRSPDMEVVDGGVKEPKLKGGCSL
jgi:hypothetical protein